MNLEKICRFKKVLKIYLQSFKTNFFFYQISNFIRFIGRLKKDVKK